MQFQWHPALSCACCTKYRMELKDRQGQHSLLAQHASTHSGNTSHTPYSCPASPSPMFLELYCGAVCCMITASHSRSTCPCTADTQLLLLFQGWEIVGSIVSLHATVGLTRRLCQSARCQSPHCRGTSQKSLQCLSEKPLQQLLDWQSRLSLRNAQI